MRRGRVDGADAEGVVACWVYKGVSCLIRKVHFSDFFCGYAGVEKGHPLYMVPYSKVEGIEVHGGLTFSGSFLKGVWFFGFDCGHSYDDPAFGGTKKDFDYVIQETNSLADQLRKWSDEHGVQEAGT